MTSSDLATLHAAAFTMPRPWTADEFASLIARKGVFLITHQTNGFALGRALAGEAELLTMAVVPNAQGQGIGHRLMDDFIAQARALGAEDVFLEVATTNAPAIALYLAHGFEDRGVRKGYYSAADGTPVDARVMGKTLKPRA